MNEITIKSSAQFSIELSLFRCVADFLCAENKSLCSLHIYVVKKIINFDVVMLAHLLLYLCIFTLFIQSPQNILLYYLWKVVRFYLNYAFILPISLDLQSSLTDFFNYYDVMLQLNFFPLN